MSSPQSRSSIPPPRQDSSRPSSSASKAHEDATPRSSFDHGYYQAGTHNGESSTSRRPSSSSIHHSPTSTSSSSRHGHGPMTDSSSGKGWSGNGVASKAGNSEGVGIGPGQRLPRITTSSHWARETNSQTEEGPRSAPTSGPLRPSHDGLQTGPLRSSSSPDPRNRNGFHSGSNEHSPSNSPTESRFPTTTTSPSLILGPPYPVTSRGTSPAPNASPADDSQNNPNIPPRISSHNADTRTITPQNSHPSLHGPLATGTSEGSMIGCESQSLNVREASGSATPRSKRGEPTYCGQCGQVVHGQFVRAMSKVFHLNCFRCKVSVASVVTSSR
jgi:hypothetical protein